MTPDELLQAAAENHRAWFRHGALASGGRVERLGLVELVVAHGEGTIPFPRPAANIDEVVQRIRLLGLRNVGCWSLAADPELGTALVARGFGWGWQPHWMALDLDRLADAQSEYGVAPATEPYARRLPYHPPAARELARAIHLGVRLNGLTVGHIAVAPWRGVAGIYSMGVAPGYRRRGIGRALTIAACSRARAQGCRYAVLNATEDGERVYRKLGFQSLGWGQTWWLLDAPIPSARQVALAEAIGHGDLETLAGLEPTGRELEAPLPGDTSPLRLALLTGRVDSADWLLERQPSLASRRFEPFGGTLLHLAVECNRPEFIELALARGVDPLARDKTWNSTPLEWARHFDNLPIGELLSQ